MKIFPAVDLFEKKAVRLFKGDYKQMTVYSDNPLATALDFQNKGAKYIHIVDLEGAKDGTTPNFEIVKEIAAKTNLFTEIGGGIRNMETVGKYLENGIDRVILGTAAVTDNSFLCSAVEKYGSRIAVGADIKDGFVAIKGWTENSEYSCFDFCEKMAKIGVKNIICTDISKDGAIQGINAELYRQLSEKFDLDITASGGVTSIDDIITLKNMDVYGVIIGKAYYTGAIDLKRAVEVAE